MLYDHRNLITELKHQSRIIGDPIYLTKYYYDEAGNRIRKMTYQYIGSNVTDPSANSDVSNTNNWELVNDEVFSRDVSGREMAIYKDNEIEEYPLYGLDMIGKLIKDVPNYYYKDHLGSVRAIVNPDNELVSAQDYDQWGYILEGRTFESDVSKFKFTSKERDQESFYDYFGARYYDARIANWGSIDPLLEKHYDFSPYNYVLRNPLRLIDPDGQQVDIINFGVNLYSSILEGQEQNKITSRMSSEEKAEYYGMSMDEYSRGNVEATGDEMIIGDLAIVGAKVGLFATLKGIGRLATEESGSVLSKELVKTGKQFTTHASEQIGERQITKTMVQKALEKGTIYWDPKNKVFNYILENKFASGKSLIVGKNLGGSVKTAYPTSVISRRMLKLSEDAQKIIRNF